VRVAGSALTLLLLGCSTAAPRLPAPIPPLEGEPRTAYSLRYLDITAGSGAPAEPAKCLYVHYTGWLTDGTKFDSSRDTTPAGAPRTPIGFPQGYRRVIAGWDTGFEGMRVGGQRRLLIPYQLAYGERGRPPTIPPRATLVFDVELMAVADTLPRSDSTAVRGGGAAAAAPQCRPWTAVPSPGSH
jgi:peptidylprolyl isomerase